MFLINKNYFSDNRHIALCYLFVLTVAFISLIYGVLSLDLNSTKIAKENDIIEEIVKNNNVNFSDNIFEIVINDDGNILKISNEFSSKFALKTIEINNVVTDNNKDSQFFITHNDKYVQVSSAFKIKPSSNKIVFTFGEKKYAFDLDIIFKSIDVSNKDYWYQKPDGWAKIVGDSVELRNVSGHVNSLGYRRSYINNAEISFDLIPLGRNVNLSIYFGQGTSIYIGVGGNKYVEMIQTKKTKIKNKYKYILRERGSFYFKKDSVVSVKASFRGNLYRVTFDDHKNKPSEFFFIDYSKDSTVNEKFSNIGLALWNDSDGVLISNLVIRSKEIL